MEFADTNERTMKCPLAAFPNAGGYYLPTTDSQNKLRGQDNYTSLLTRYTNTLATEEEATVSEIQVGGTKHIAKGNLQEDAARDASN